MITRVLTSCSLSFTCQSCSSISVASLYFSNSPAISMLIYLALLIGNFILTIGIALISTNGQGSGIDQCMNISTDTFT